MGQYLQIEMEDPGSLLVKTKKYLRSALLSTKGGVPAEQVYRDYRDLVGEGIPYRRLGYETLENFLTSVPDVSKYPENLRERSLLWLWQTKQLDTFKTLSVGKHLKTKKVRQNPKDQVASPCNSQ